MSTTEKSSDQQNGEAEDAPEHSEGEVTTGGEVENDEEIGNDKEAGNGEEVGKEEAGNEEEAGNDGEAGNEEAVETEEQLDFEEESESDMEIVSSEGKVSSTDLTHSNISPGEVPGGEDGPPYPYERASLEDTESLRPSESRDVEAIPTEPSRQLLGSSKQMGQDASRRKVSKSGGSPRSANASVLLPRRFVTRCEELRIHCKYQLQFLLEIP